MHQAIRLVRRFAVLALLAVLLLACGGALADESMQVSIPVTARDADCTVELYDSAGHRVQFVKLREGETSTFNIQCTGLGRSVYTALVADRDTPDVSYDRSNYRITIDLVYDENGQMSAMMFIENLVSSESKLPGLVFVNEPTAPVVTPTPMPVVTPTPTPVPTPTPIPGPTPTPTPEYKYRFNFTKVWNGDEHGDSIDWTMYNADGTKRTKKFNKETVNDDIWRYEAYFTSSVADCYVIEVPPEGYMVHYENVGAYSEVTDRCHIGGTIVNSKIPQTSDDTPLDLYFAAILLAALGLCLLGRLRLNTAKTKP